MLSAHRFCLAASCAALTLGLLPRISAAQSADTPFFAEDLTRARIGDIPNLDEQVGSLARMAPDGHMIITGAETDVWVPAGKYVELLPKLKIVGFTPVTLKVFEDRQETRTYGLEKTGELPILRVDPPTGASNRKLVQVAVYDA